MKKQKSRRGTGSTWTRYDREGKVIGYGASVTVGPYKRRKVYAKDQPALESKIRAVLKAAEDGTLTEPNRDTVASFLARWLEDTVRSNRRQHTYAMYESVVRLHIVPFIGAIKLTALSSAQLRAFYARLGREGRSPRMRQIVHLRLHTALKQAEIDRLIGHNPAADVEPPTAPKRSMTALDLPETMRFLELARCDRLAALYVLAVTTGMRQGEILALRWQDVDLAGAALTVHHTLMRSAGGRWSLQPPKTETSRRRVLLSAMAVEALEQHCEPRLRVPSEFVFTTVTGAPLNKDNFVGRSFKRILREAGLPEIRFHDLRHTSASLLLASGQSHKVVQERLGHANASITLNTYAHVGQTMQRDAANLFDQILGARVE
jgi:integrase